MSHFLFLTASYLLALFFIILGLFCAAIPWSQSLQTALLDTVQQQEIAVVLTGVALLAIGCVILAQLARRRRYYSVRTSGVNVVSVDKDLVKAYLHEYFHTQYPTHEVPCHVTVKSNRLQITADLPTTPRQEQKGILKKIEQELQELLSARLGYQQPLRLYVSFAE